MLVGAVGGDDHGRALVAPTDYLEEQVSTEFIDRQIAELIDNKQAGLEVATNLALQAAGGLRGGQRIDDVDGSGEEHGVAADAGGMAKGDGAVGFAEANGTYKHGVGVGSDEGQAEQVLDLRAVDLLWPAPLEVLHRLEDGEAGLSDAPLDGAGLASGGLTLDQLGQIGEMRELLLGGCGGKGLVVGGKGAGHRAARPGA